MLLLLKMFSIESALPYLIGSLVMIMFVAYLMDRRANAKRSNEEYESQYIYSGQINKMTVGVIALQRRGENIDKYLELIIPILMSDSIHDRVGAKMILKKCYPDDFDLIKGYEGSNQEDVRREKVKPLFDKHGIEIS